MLIKEILENMKVLLYATEAGEAGERLARIIKTSLDSIDIQVCRSIRSLTQKLCQLKNGFLIAVLVAHNKKELLEILSLKDLFWNLRIILILPNHEKDTISKGHQLYPRFLSYVDSDFKDVAAVLEKMLKHLSSIQFQYKGDEVEWLN
jgi:hypothetical protein